MLSLFLYRHLLCLPECIPIRNCSLSFGLCRIVNCLIASKRHNDMLAISPACSMPFLIGRPLTYKEETKRM